MTVLICRYAGIAAFVAFSIYGLLGTLRVVRSPATPPGPRPWALFAAFELVEAVQLYGLLATPTPRPAADIRSGAIVALAALFCCAYLQRLFLTAGPTGPGSFPRRAFYLGLLGLLCAVFAAHLAGPYLP